MGKEILAIPEEYLGDVIKVILMGLVVCLPPMITTEASDFLMDWCERYKDDEKVVPL